MSDKMVCGTLFRIDEIVESRAREVLCLATSKRIKHADAAETLFPNIGGTMRSKVLDKAIELFIQSKAETAKHLQRRLQ